MVTPSDTGMSPKDLLWERIYALDLTAKDTAVCTALLCSPKGWAGVNWADRAAMELAVMVSFIERNLIKEEG